MRIPKTHVGFEGWDWMSHHTHYGHVHVPDYRHVRCPTCNQRATVRCPSLLQHYEIRCPKCLLRKAEVSESKLPPLYYSVGVAARELWAWNREHLAELLEYLQSPGYSRRNKPLMRYFIRREWLLHRRQFAKAIEHRLRNDA
jgi:hypothetical protein